MKALRILYLTLFFAPSACAQTVVGTLTHADMQPYSVAVYEAGNKVFVADQTDGKVYMYDGATLEEQNSAFVGYWTYSMLVNEASGKLYAAPMNHASIAVVDAATGNFSKYIAYPDGYDFNFPNLAQDPGLGKVYVSGALQIDVATDTVTPIPGSGGYCQGVNPVTHELFSAQFGVDVNQLVVVNGSTLTTSTISGLGARCTNVGINPQENKVYIATGGGIGIPFKVLDRDDNSVANVYADNDALGWAYNPTSNRMYTDSEVNAVSTMIEGASNSYVNISMPQATTGIAVHSASNHIFYAGMDFVAILDDPTRTLKSIPVTNPSPSAILLQQIAINQTTGRAFVINDGHALNFVTVVQDNTGGGYGPEIQLAPRSLSFGSGHLSVFTDSQSVTLSNVGANDASVADIEISGGNTGDFSFFSACPLSPNKLGPGEYCTISVNFRAAAPGSRKAALIVSSDAPGSPHRIMLTGQGSAVSLSPTDWNFGSLPTQASSAPKVITLTNLGGTPIHVWSSSVTGVHAEDFSRTGNCPAPPATLAGGNSCTFSVTFTPKAAGAHTAPFAISHDGGGSPASVSLTGTGTSVLQTQSVSPQVIVVPLLSPAEVQASDDAPPAARDKRKTKTAKKHSEPQ